MFSFVGLLILFGLTNKNDFPIHLLWSVNSMLHFSVFASVTMSRDRFQFICRHICFDDFDQKQSKTIKIINSLKCKQSSIYLKQTFFWLFLQDYFALTKHCIHSEGCALSDNMFQTSPHVMVLNIGA